jgi:hypothetical protein
VNYINERSEELQRNLQEDDQNDFSIIINEDTDIPVLNMRKTTVDELGIVKQLKNIKKKNLINCMEQLKSIHCYYHTNFQ